MPTPHRYVPCPVIRSAALDTYRLLRTEIGAEGQCYRELRGTGWVQHFSTSDSCKACNAEFERRWGALRPGEEGQP